MTFEVESYGGVATCLQAVYDKYGTMQMPVLVLRVNTTRWEALS